MPTAEDVGENQQGYGRAWYALGVLTVVLMIASSDRQIISLLAEPIRKSLALSDLQLGLLQGTGASLFTAVACYPIAWTADRADRRLVLGFSIVVWSLAVAACGLAGSFVSLFVAGSMVAAGEAGLGPLTYSIIPDLFRREHRQIANSIFAVTTSAGSSLALALCGFVIALVERYRAVLPPFLAPFESWRLSFFAVALPAPIMLALLATLRLPRSDAVLKAVKAGRANGLDLGTFLRRHPTSVFGLYGGFSFSCLGYSAFLAWLPVICMRRFGQSAAQVGYALGIGVLIATGLGFGLSVLIARRFTDSWGPVLPIKVVRASIACSAAVLAMMAFAEKPIHVYVLVVLMYVAVCASNMSLPTALQNLAPPHLRARLTAVHTVIVLTSAAAGAPLVGLISDHLTQGGGALLPATLGVAVPCLCAAVLILGLSERTYAATAEESLAFEASAAPVYG